MKLRQNEKRMAILSANFPLQSVANDTLGTSFTMQRGNKFLLLIKDRFSKLIRTVPLRSITAFAVAYAFLTHLTLLYMPSFEVKSDNEKQFS